MLDQAIKRNREFCARETGCVPDGIRDRARLGCNPDLAHANVRIVLLNQDRFERRHGGA